MVLICPHSRFLVVCCFDVEIITFNTWSSIYLQCFQLSSLHPVLFWCLSVSSLWVVVETMSSNLDPSFLTFLQMSAWVYAHMYAGMYHSTFEITYSGLILGEFNFVIISAKITAQNSVMIFFANFVFFNRFWSCLSQQLRIPNQAGQKTLDFRKRNPA